MTCNLDKLKTSLGKYKDALGNVAPTIITKIGNGSTIRPLVGLNALTSMLEALDDLTTIRKEKAVSEEAAKKKVKANPIMGSLSARNDSPLGINESKLNPTGFNLIELVKKGDKITSADGLGNEDGSDFVIDTKLLPMYENVENVITGKTGVFDRSISKALSKKDMPSVLRMLKTSKGEVNHNMVLALYSSLMNTLTNNYRKLSEQRDLDYVYYLRNKDPDTDVLENGFGDMAKLADGGVSELELTDSIGKDMVAALGLLDDQDKDVMAFKKTRSELGALGLAMAYDLGILEKPADPSDKKQSATSINFDNIRITRIKKMGEDGKSPFQEGLGRIKDAIRYINDSFDVEMEDALNIYDSPVEQVSQVKTRTTIGNEVSDALKEHELRQQRVPYNVNSGWDKLLDMFTVKGKLDVRSLRYALGYTDEDKMKTLSGNGMITAEGRNAGIVEKVAMLQELEERRTGENFYFRFETDTNDRSRLASKITPQMEKELFRWLISPALPTYTITDKMLNDVVNMKDDLDTLDSIEALKSKDNYKEMVIAHQFMYGVVQALDGVVVGGSKIKSADNMRNSTIVEEYLKIAEAMRKDKGTAKDIVDQIVEAGKTKGDSGTHIGHVMLALANMERLLAGKGEFETDMIVEFDGKTNGLSYRVMQYAVGNYKEYLPKIGLRGKDEHITSLGDLKDAKTSDGDREFDSYEHNGGSVLQEFDKIVNNNSNDSNEFVRKELAKGKSSRLPVLSTSSDALKVVRNLMKDPVMIFVYGAGILAIAKNVSTKIANEYLDKVMSEIPIGEHGFVGESGSYRLTEKGVTTALAAFGMKDDFKSAEVRKKTVAAIEDLKNRQVDVTSTSALGNVIANRVYRRVATTYGAAISTALGKEFKVQQQVNSALNSAAGAAFNMFESVYNAELDKARSSNGGLLTGKMVKDIQKKLEGMLPNMKTFNSKGRSDGLTLIKGKAGKQKQKNNNKYVSADVAGVQVLVMADGLEGVGAKMPVLPTHSADSNSMARTLKDSVEADPVYGQFTQIFDALAMHVANTTAGSSYNKNWYEDNRDNSILANMLGMLNGVSNEYGKYLESNKELTEDWLPAHEMTSFSATKAELRAERAAITAKLTTSGREWNEETVDNILDNRKFDSSTTQILTTKVISDANRSKLFAKDHVVMQMGGGFNAYKTEGSGNTTTGTDLDEAAKWFKENEVIFDVESGIIGKPKTIQSREDLKDQTGSYNITGSC
jgi:hypothetical protein